MDHILYHYCSSQTGFSILNTRTFRLSALSSANDSLEGRVLGRVFSEVLLETGLPQGLSEIAAIIVSTYPLATEGFAFCLSEEGDLLSQWRAYASDGSGISIGFSREILEKDFGNVNFGSEYYDIVKVDYGEDVLRVSLKPIAKDIHAKFFGVSDSIRLADGITPEKAMQAFSEREGNVKGIFQGTDETSTRLLADLLKALSPLHFKIYNTKPKTFFEEREWRLLSFSHRIAKTDIDFFADTASIRPYMSCLIADPAREAISEVILGPKHRTNIDWMRAFLSSVGLEHVRVSKSAHESYR